MGSCFKAAVGFKAHVFQVAFVLVKVTKGSGQVFTKMKVMHQ